MPKSQIRPPRRPAKEDPAVTIANQEREIENLIDRVQTVVKERDGAMLAHCQAMDRIHNMTKEIESHKSLGNDLCERISDMEKAHTRLQGWQDCAREIFDRIRTE